MRHILSINRLISLGNGNNVVIVLMFANFFGELSNDWRIESLNSIKTFVMINNCHENKTSFAFNVIKVFFYNSLEIRVIISIFKT